MPLDKKSVPRRIYEQARRDFIRSQKAQIRSVSDLHKAIVKGSKPSKLKALEEIVDRMSRKCWHWHRRLIEVTDNYKAHGYINAKGKWIGP